MIAAIYARKSQDQHLPDAEKSVTRQIEHATALVDLARGNDDAGFLVLAGTVGLSREASTILWSRTRRRLGVPVTAPLE